MSILKFANGKNNGNESLKRAIDYIVDSEKTTDDLISGNGISIPDACNDMETIQFLFGKSSGRRYIHYIISFDKNVSKETAFEVAEEASSYFAKEYQYIFSIHTNTENVHAHIIVNAVNIQTGKKFSQSKADMLKFRDFINDCLSIHGLNLIGQSDDSTLFYETGDLDEGEDLDDLFEGNDEMNTENCHNTFFGVIDPDEISQIQCAQLHDRNMQEIIHFFEGEAEELPPNIYYDDAEMLYQEWLDSWKTQEEEF